MNSREATLERKSRLAVMTKDDVKKVLKAAAHEVSNTKNSSDQEELLVDTKKLKCANGTQQEKIQRNGFCHQLEEKDESCLNEENDNKDGQAAKLLPKENRK